MAAFTTIAATAAIGATAAGGYMQYQGAKDQSAAQQQQIAAQQEAERLRKKQMELDARRRTVEMVRMQQRTRAAALAVATAQGTKESSGLQGAYGAISGQSGVNMLGVSQNLQLGRQMFGANMDLSNANMAYADAGTTAAYGRGVSAIGTTIMGNLDGLSRVAGGFGQSYGATSPSYGGWYNLAQTGGYPFPTPYGQA